MTSNISSVNYSYLKNSPSFDQHIQYIEHLNECNDYPAYLEYLNENRSQLFYTLTDSLDIIDGLLGTVVSSFWIFFFFSILFIWYHQRVIIPLFFRFFSLIGLTNWKIHIINQSYLSVIKSNQNLVLISVTTNWAIWVLITRIDWPSHTLFIWTYKSILYFFTHMWVYLVAQRKLPAFYRLFS